MLNDRNIDLIDEGIDVALRIGPLADSTLSARLVGHVGRLWVASPAYLKRRGVPRAPGDLAHHEAILGTVRANREWSFAGLRTAPRLMGRLRVDDVETRLRAARDGRGVAQLLSYQVADELSSGKLMRLLQAWEARPLPNLCQCLGSPWPPPARAQHRRLRRVRRQTAQDATRAGGLGLPEPLGELGSTHRRNDADIGERTVVECAQLPARAMAPAPGRWKQGKGEPPRARGEAPAAVEKCGRDHGHAAILPQPRDPSLRPATNCPRPAFDTRCAIA